MNGWNIVSRSMKHTASTATFLKVTVQTVVLEQMEEHARSKWEINNAYKII